jgi:hypothetical protein
MKLTKGRIHKLFLKEKQTRKHIKPKSQINHVITYKQKKTFNLRNRTIKSTFEKDGTKTIC